MKVGENFVIVRSLVSTHVWPTDRQTDYAYVVLLRSDKTGQSSFTSKHRVPVDACSGNNELKSPYF